jgi:hypothetical protein
MLSFIGVNCQMLESDRLPDTSTENDSVVSHKILVETDFITWTSKYE